MEYVQKMGGMLDRNLITPHKRVCISDESNIPGWEIIKSDRSLKGWWQKISCFPPGRFEGRILYLDLDSVIVGSLDRLAASKGIIHLNRWGWTTQTYGSGVMAWDAGEHRDIWDKFSSDTPTLYRGDQDYMTALGGWEELPDGVCCSYRYRATRAPPAGVSVVAFHGRPKPSDLPPGHWVHQYWRV